MKKVLFVLALVVAYGVSVSTASADVIFGDEVKTTVVAADSDNAKEVKEVKTAEVDSEAKAEGCAGTAAKAEGCAGAEKTASAEGCASAEKTASAGACGGEKTAEK
jgi:hypothetical protein